MAVKSLVFDLFGRDRTASKTIKGVGDSAQRMGRQFRAAGKVVGLGIAAAAGAVTAFGISSVQAFAEAETSQNKLAFAFEKFPKLADTNVIALQKYNKALAKKTYFDDDALASGQAILAQFKLTGDQIKQLTPLVADYAAKTGQSFEDSAIVIGKAVLGNGKALKNVGIKFKDTGTIAGNFGQLIEALGGTVGGFAEKDLKTAAGRVKDLQDRFDEIKESIGEKLLPDLIVFAGFFETTLLPKIEQLGTFITEKAIPVLKQFKDFVVANTDVLGPLAVVFGVLAAAIVVTVSAIVNPIGTAIAASIAGLALFIAAVFAGYDLLKRFAPGVLDFFNSLRLGFFDFQMAVANGFINVSMGVNRFLQDSANSIIGFLNPVIAALNIILGIFGVNKMSMIGRVDLTSGLKNIQSGLNAYASGARAGTSGGGGTPARAMALGGIVRPVAGGTNVTIGEAGQAEAVIPLSAGALSKYGLRGGTTVNVNLTGTYAGSKTDLARTVVRAIVDAQKIGAVPRGQLA